MKMTFEILEYPIPNPKPFPHSVQVSPQGAESPDHLLPHVCLLHLLGVSVQVTRSDAGLGGGIGTESAAGTA